MVKQEKSLISAEGWASFPLSRRGNKTPLGLLARKRHITMALVLCRSTLNATPFYSDRNYAVRNRAIMS